MAKTTTTNSPIELDGFRHPLTGQVLMMTPSDTAAYLKFTTAFSAELRPEGFLEEQLAQSLADAQWRMNFARALENNILSTEAAIYAQSIPTAETESQAAVILARRAAKGAIPFTFSMYEQRLNNQFHKNLKLYRETQAERRRQRTEELDKAAEILKMEKAKVTAAKPLTYCPSEDGFIFSIPEIEDHIRLRARRHAAHHFTKSRAAAA